MRLQRQYEDTYKVLLKMMMIRAVNKVKTSLWVLFKYGITGFVGRMLYGRQYALKNISLIYFLFNGIVSLTIFPFCLSKKSRILKKIVYSSSSCKIVLTHDWDGGADAYLTNVINDACTAQAIFVIRPTETPKILCIQVYYNRLRIEEFLVKGLSFLLSVNLTDVEIVVNELIRWHQYDRSRVVSVESIKCLVDEILELKKKFGARLIYLVHDYYCICPRYTLMSPQGCYCASESEMKSCASCLSDVASSILPQGMKIDISEWRNVFSSLFAECDEVRTFSADTCRRIQRCYPGFSPTIVPHKQIHFFERKPRTTGGSLVIGVFGRINRIKGAQIVVALAWLLATKSSRAKIVVVGELKLREKDSLPPNIIVTGKYKVDDLPNIIEKYGINVAFMSSIIPETFSYVTQEIIALGLPLVAFNIGAPKDVVANYNKGAVAKEISAGAALNAIENLYDKIYA